jgi:hypothetical protein
MDTVIERMTEVSAPPATPRRSLVATWRALNTSVDNVFYDVTALSDPERERLSAYVAPESSIVTVHPRAENAAIEVLRPVDFVQQQLARSRPHIDTIVVAGVGSSAVGTAALARNVADHTGQAVAGVVSGFGVADIVAEAMGGWFVLGAANIVRDAIARTLDACQIKDHVRDQSSHEHIKACVQALGLTKNEFIYGSPDSTVLLYLLCTLGERIRTLVGHSKGNYSIDNALRGWVTASQRTGKPLHTDLCIVTLGAVIRLPAEFSNVHQFIGTSDYFGMMNSRPFLDCCLVPGKWHSLNTRFRSELSVHDALTGAAIPGNVAPAPVAPAAEKPRNERAPRKAKRVKRKRVVRAAKRVTGNRRPKPGRRRR